MRAPSSMARRSSRVVPLVPVLLLLLAASPTAVRAQQRDDTTAATYDVYGFAMLDLGLADKANNPQWYDVNRPSKLPAFEHQYGLDNNFFASVRQTRFGVKTTTSTPAGRLHTWFEFDMFGVGSDAGQTTIRPRHFWGELGSFGAGQTNSPFMDGNVFPNTVEYWGPNGMMFLRTPQVRWTPVRGTNEFMIALEKPGGSADAGNYADRVEVQNARARFPAPDLSAAYKLGTKRGYVRFAGIVRVFKIDDLLTTDAIDLTKSITAAGGSVSSILDFNEKNDVLRLQANYGTGIENYFNDAPFDVGVKQNPGNATKPIEAVPLPIFGMSAYLDHTWNSRFSSSIGYSRVDIDNSNGQPANAYHIGQYASTNLLFYPAKNVMTGFELMWGHRENFSDGFKVSDFRLQFSAKYNFSFSGVINSGGPVGSSGDGKGNDH